MTVEGLQAGSMQKKTERIKLAQNATNTNYHIKLTHYLQIFSHNSTINHHMALPHVLSIRVHICLQHIRVLQHKLQECSWPTYLFFPSSLCLTRFIVQRARTIYYDLKTSHLNFQPDRCLLEKSSQFNFQCQRTLLNVLERLQKISKRLTQVIQRLFYIL